MDHLKILSILNFLQAAVSLLLALLASLAAGAMVITNAGGDGLILTILVAGTVVLLALVMAGVEVLAGLQVRHGKGRLLQTILSALWFFSFPLGSAHALYGM